MTFRAAVRMIVLGMGGTAVILFGWIGLVYAVNTYTSVIMTAEAALNLIIVALLAVVGLPVIHAANYRWFWHVHRNQVSGAISFGRQIPAFGSEPTASPPRVNKTAGQRLLYASLYAVGILSLIAAYAPIDHQAWLAGLLARFSAGRESFSSLARLVVIYLPMMVSLAIIAPFVEWDRRRLEDGVVDREEALRLQAKREWLFAFAAAFVMTGFIAFVAGTMILGFL